MSTCIFASILIALACIGIAESQFIKFKTEWESMIVDEDLELVNSKEGLWFSDDNGRPVRVTVDMPAEVENSLWTPAKDVLFYLYTRPDYENEILRVNDEKSVKNSHFNSMRETKIITHGWLSDKDSDSCTFIRDAYLDHGDYNIIVVDWSKVAKIIWYPWAASHVESVGKYVAEFVDFMQKEGMDLKKTTMVGFSLGAHVVGVAGHHTSGAVNNIVGLDPAKLGFSSARKGQRVSNSDAKYVEVVHADPSYLGYHSNIGTADFYLNGFSKQPGCGFWENIIGCSHKRAYRYFAESINDSTVGFWGDKCNDWSELVEKNCKGDRGIMGGPKSQTLPAGIYYVKTNSKSPFAMG